MEHRPDATPYPAPAAADDAFRVYLSVGHQQMMTDAMTPLGLSMWQRTALPLMHEAGGRLFVEVTDRLASPATRPGLIAMVGRGDPLTGDALQRIVSRGVLAPPPEDDAGPGSPPPPAPAAAAAAVPAIATDPAVVTELIERSEAANDASRRALAAPTGAALFDAIDADIAGLKQLLFDPRSHQVFMGAMEATWWLNDHLLTWLGEKNVADALTLSVPNNVTSEMGLALLDLADVVRPHPAVVALLASIDPSGDDRAFVDELATLDGGHDAHAAFVAFLHRYGMRCPGEIDIARPRWRERPSALVPVIVGHVRNFAPGEAARRVEHGRRQAAAKEHDVLTRLRALPGGGAKADETKAMIDRVRTFIGYREYPKYFMIDRYYTYKQALVGEAHRLVAAGVFAAADDVFWFSFAELRDIATTGRADRATIDRRKDAFRSYQAMTPPRVLTSDGSEVAGDYGRHDAPAGALVGLAVSAGVVEGRARVVVDAHDADLEPGDILVTAFTDPSWTPLFVTIAGLVTEVGGLMTHGAVIAREYGLPAVVGVLDATRLIRDGQRIRVHGTDGHVELLP